MAMIIARLTRFIVVGIVQSFIACPTCAEAKGSRAKGHRHGALAGLGQSLYLPHMAHVFDHGDRARLRERFYGATHSVLARLDG